MRYKAVQPRARRKARSRAKLQGTAERPRLVVHRSLRGLNAQLIDDEARKTLVAADTRAIDIQADAGERGAKVAAAYHVGRAIAVRALEKKIKTIIFDRSGYRYHGRVRALAEGARDGGLIF